MQSWPRLAALAAIRGYQRFISPHKGFACAWRVHTGGASCSALGLRVIRRHGLWRGLQLLRERTYRCGVAHRRCGHARGPGISALVAQQGHCDLSCDAPADCSGPGHCHLPHCDLSPGECCDCASGCGDCGSGGGGNCDWPARRSRGKDKLQYVHIPPKRHNRTRPGNTTRPTLP